MNRSVIITDNVSDFPRDQVPLAIRIQQSVKEGTELGDLQIVRTRGLIDLVEKITRKGIAIDKAKRGEDCAVYLLVGYREALSGKYSLSASMEALRYITHYFDKMGFTIRYLLPIIKSRRLEKTQKEFFGGLHKQIKEMREIIENLKILNAPLIGIDPISPNGKSIVGVANALGHDIAIRKIKLVVQDLDLEDRTVRARSTLVSDSSLKIVEKDRIFIDEEIPRKVKRRSTGR